MSFVFALLPGRAKMHLHPERSYWNNMRKTGLDIIKVESGQGGHHVRLSFNGAHISTSKCCNLLTICRWKKPRKTLEVAWCHRRSCVATLIQLLNQDQSKGIDKQGQGATERGERWGHNFISFNVFAFVSLPFSPGFFCIACQ